MQPAAYLVPKCSTGAPKQPQKPPKWPILPISAKNGHFGHFGGFWGPPCAPCGPFWAQIGLWLHTSGCILPFWWLRNHSEPSQMKKNFLKKNFFSRCRVPEGLKMHKSFSRKLHWFLKNKIVTKNGPRVVERRSKGPNIGFWGCLSR